MELVIENLKYWEYYSFALIFITLLPSSLWTVFLSQLNSVSDSSELCGFFFFLLNTFKKSVNKYINRSYFLRPTVKGKKQNLLRSWKWILGSFAVLRILSHRNDEYSEVWFAQFSSYWSALKIYWQEGIFLSFCRKKWCSKSSTSLSDFQRELIKISFHFRRLIIRRRLNSECFYK